MATEIMAPANPDNGLAVLKKNRIQVSNTKKPLFFYVNLAKRYMQQHNEVELSALGMAIATVVTIAEILKNNGLAIEKKVLTSTFGMKDETKGRLVQKARIEIVLGKSENFETIINANTTTEKDANNTTAKETNNITAKDDANSTTAKDANNTTAKEANNTTAKEANNTTAKETNNTTAKEANDTTAKEAAKDNKPKE